MQMQHDALDNEEYRDFALQWVGSNAYMKGTPNMTDADFCSWVDSSLLPKVSSSPSKISVRTARQWLHKLGFELQ